MENGETSSTPRSLHSTRNYAVSYWSKILPIRQPGDPKSRNGRMVEWRNGGMAEWRKKTPNPKTRNGCQGMLHKFCTKTPSAWLIYPHDDNARD